MFDFIGSALGSIGSAIGGGLGTAASWLGDTANTAYNAGKGLLSSGLGSVLGSVGAGAGQYLSQDATNAMNLELVQQQNAAAMARQHDTQSWEANMANTAEQRQVADLKAAGLNPILAARGAGAAVPNVSSPPVQAGQVQNAMGGAIGTAISSAQAFNDLRLRAEQIRTQAAQTDATLAQARKSNVDADSAVLDLSSKQFYYGDKPGQMSGYQADWLKRMSESSMSADNAIKAAFDARNADLQGRILDRERQARDYELVGQKAAADVSSSWAGRNVIPYLERIVPSFAGSARGARDLGLVPR